MQTNISKKVLIITAHPSSYGTTHFIARAYKEGVLEAGGEATIIDLYKDDVDAGKHLPYLNFEEKSDMAKPLEARTYYQELINESDEVVFIHPLWWMSMPAIMKNFLDNVFAAKWAFVYENGKPKGLLKGKKISVFITCDGSRFMYYLLAIPFCTTWMLGIGYFCGMKHGVFKIFDKKYARTNEEKQAFLNKVRHIAKKL